MEKRHEGSLTADECSPVPDTLTPPIHQVQSHFNGYASQDNDEDCDEPVGVFDYVLPCKTQKKCHTENGPITAEVSTLADDSDGDGTDMQRRWACTAPYRTGDDNGTELTTIHSAALILHAEPSEEKMVNGGASDDAGCELQEVIVQSEIRPQRASIERYNPDKTHFSSVKYANGLHVDNKDEQENNQDNVEQRSMIASPYGAPNDRSISTVDVTQESRSSTDSAVDSYPRQNVLYFDSLFRTGGFMADGYDERYGQFPQTEAGRRLLRKRQKREQRRAEDRQTRLSQDVDEYKGTLSLDELIAFINNTKTDKNSKSGETNTVTTGKAASASAGRDRSGRKKKKNHGTTAEVSDAASSVNEDHSVSSGIEGLNITDETLVLSADDAPVSVCHEIDNIVTKDLHCTEFPESTSFDTSASLANVPVDISSSLDREHFVIVKKKKKKTKQLLDQYASRNNQNPPVVTPGSRTFYSRRNQTHVPGFSGYEARRDESLTSDTESSSSHARERVNDASIRSYSPDFPDLILDRTPRIRRNSTGNVCANSDAPEKTPLPASFITSYAIVAASGLAISSAADRERRRSLDCTADTSCRVDNASISGVFQSSCSKFNDHAYVTSSDIDDHSDKSAFSAGAAPLETNVTSNSEMHNNSNVSLSLVSSPATSDKVGDHAACSSDISIDSASRPKVINLPMAYTAPTKTLCQDAGTRQQNEAPKKIPTSAVARDAASNTDRKTKMPVVFMDIGSDIPRTQPVATDIGISFVFDETENVPALIERRSVAVGDSSCAKCAEHSTEKPSAVASMDSATSPIDPHDFDCAENGSSVSPQTSAVSHSRPIVPLSSSVHQPPGHTPIGIVPPIPQGERVVRCAPVIDHCDTKDLIEMIPSGEDQTCVQDMKSSGEGFTLAKLKMNIAQQATECPLNSRTVLLGSLSSRPGTFNLLNCQIFMYKDFEDTMSEKSKYPGKVVQYKDDM